MEIEFIPINYDYLSVENKTYVRIFGKTKKGKSCCVIDEPINYFYVLTEDPEKMEKDIEDIEGVDKTEVVEKNFLGKKVKAIRVYCDFKDRGDISKEIKDKNENVKIKEKDLPLLTKYIINKKIRPLIWYNVEGKSLNDEDMNGLPASVNTDIVIELDKVRELKKQEDFKPKVLAFDIETEEFDIGKGKIMMVSLVTDDFKKVLTWKKCANAKNYVECLKDEKEMLKKFEEYINKINPDIITGYFSDGFDLPYIRARARKNNLELRFGQGEGKIIFSKGRFKKSRINGLTHIDLFKFIKTVYSQYLDSETLSLDDVASELLDEKKVEIDHMHKATKDLKEKEWEKFFEYNLQDSVLTWKLFQESWPDMLELTKIIQEQLYETTRYTFSKLVEHYIIHNLDKFNEISEERPSHEIIKKRRARAKTEGAFVLQPNAGLYENLSIFDFTSMHTSIIVSFNISKSTLLDKKKKDAYKSPKIKFGNKKKEFYFDKKPGFFPQLAEEIMDLRKKYKKQYKENPNPITKARSNAFKVLSASIHGYIAYFGARYYSYECSNSILAFVRKFNKDIINKARKEGYEVIYSDTDAIAITLGDKKKKDAKKFLGKLNRELPGIMELDLEGFFKRGIWVTKRSGKFGAKKKYALIDKDGNLKIRGFETVRRDWCKLARETQNTVLKKILENGNEKEALKFLRKTIKKIENRDIDRKKLIIRTQLKKSLDEYKAKTPHIVVARKMKEKGLPIKEGSLISYYVAEGKEKALVRERAKLPEEGGKYDIKYYLEKQILPSVENIFQVFGINKDEILEGKKQTKLAGF